MNEVKNPKVRKPLIYYYMMALLIMLLLNTFLFPACYVSMPGLYRL